MRESLQASGIFDTAIPQSRVILKKMKNSIKRKWLSQNVKLNSPLHT